MTTRRLAIAEFHKGDEVVMSEGTYQGTTGIFIGLRADCAWADISEPNGVIRCHPIAWMALGRPAV